MPSYLMLPSLTSMEAPSGWDIVRLFFIYYFIIFSCAVSVEKSWWKCRIKEFWLGTLITVRICRVLLFKYCEKVGWVSNRRELLRLWGVAHCASERVFCRVCTNSLVPPGAICLASVWQGCRRFNCARARREKGGPAVSYAVIWQLWRGDAVFCSPFPCIGFLLASHGHGCIPEPSLLWERDSKWEICVPWGN